MISESKNIIIITAPSGAGKTTIVNNLLERNKTLNFSISATTRKPRQNEIHGENYYFLSQVSFNEKILNNEFIEWEMVYENTYYGTLKNEIVRIWSAENIPILDIDIKGAIHIKNQFQEKCISIFIAPPSLEDLKERLLNRGTEDNKDIQTRLNKAEYELSFRSEFDIVVVNDKLVEAVNQIDSYINSRVISTKI